MNLVFIDGHGCWKWNLIDLLTYLLKYFWVGLCYTCGFIVNELTIFWEYLLNQNQYLVLDNVWEWGNQLSKYFLWKIALQSVAICSGSLTLWNDSSVIHHLFIPLLSSLKSQSCTSVLWSWNLFMSSWIWPLWSLTKRNVYPSRILLQWYFTIDT